MSDAAWEYITSRPRMAPFEGDLAEAVAAVDALLAERQQARREVQRLQETNGQLIGAGKIVVAERQQAIEALRQARDFVESVLIGDEYGNPASPLNVAARRELEEIDAALSRFGEAETKDAS